jgi:hypothetical protein
VTSGVQRAAMPGSTAEKQQQQEAAVGRAVSILRSRSDPSLPQIHDQ